MTRLVTCGWETGDINEAGVAVVGASATITAVNSTPTPRAGSYCCKGLASASTNSNCTEGFALPAALTDVWVRCAIFLHGWAAENPCIIFVDSGAVATACVTFTAADGLLRARQGATNAGTLLATASASMSQDAWHTVEVRHQMTSATVGITEVWLDGTRVINFSGDNTLSTASANTQTVRIGNVIANGLTTGAYWALDDLAINNTSGTVNNGRPGDGRVVLLSPSGAGSNTGLTRGGTDTGANYSQTSELPPSMTQYVFSATAATRDTYALGDLPVTPGTINCCEVIALAQNSDAGAGSLGLTVKSGATTNEGSAQALGTTAAYIRQLYETDPATSTAWTASGVNALEAGATVR